MAGEKWRQIVADMVETLGRNIPKYPELKPLFTSFINFDRKYNCPVTVEEPAKAKGDRAKGVKLSKVLSCFEHAGLVILEKDSYDRLMQTIDQQEEEIEALDLRIKRLLEH
jgi:hypothetical protein